MVGDFGELPAVECECFLSLFTAISGDVEAAAVVVSSNGSY